MSTRAELLKLLEAQPGAVARDAGDRLRIEVQPEHVPALAIALSGDHDCEFATLVAEDRADGFEVRYFFYTRDSGVLVQVVTTATRGASLPAISDRVHAADWHEREVEDLFGITFAGHPFLGDFVLHDPVWPEGVAPMHRGFDARKRVEGRGKGAEWRPWRLLEEDGSIAFPVGPVWADYSEAGLWILETPGEQIHAGRSRLFFKYRAVEKIAEGRTPVEALPLAERFSGSSAFAHGWAYCQALEKIAGCEVPPRARALRTVFAEFERIRYHAATLAELAGSTALAVGKSMGQELEEKLLRLAGDVCRHRYLYGLCVPGGLAWEPDRAALARLRTAIAALLAEFADYERTLVHTSSYLDRIEEMGTLRPEVADLYGVVGPVARASGRHIDLRQTVPYGGYREVPPMVAHEEEGDGYARMRVYFAEIRAGAKVIERLLANLPDGPVAVECTPRAGRALGWTEAPAGGAFHWLRLGDDGRIERWRIAPPGFRNWHAFHRSLEGAAFQDFHIIMASFGLSIAETDR